MDWQKTLNEKLAAVPAAPGVYLYRDAGGTVIYVGKAKSLRARVRQYFQESRGRDPKTEALVQEIRDLEFIVTASEYEAFLLESNLVHEHWPRYNIFLKDDKSFPFIRLTVQDTFPRISLTRRPVRDGSRYFGPYIPASRARLLIDAVRRAFGVRHCKKEIDGRAPRPCCLDYHIHRCLGPCVAEICPPELYRDAVEAAALFLEGKNRELLARLREQMAAAAAAEHFERAAILRDQIAAVRALTEQQQVVLTQEDDADIFHYHHSGRRLAVQVFLMRGSKVVDRRQYFWENLEAFEPAGFLRDFLQQFYFQEMRVPPRVLVPGPVAERELLAQWLSDKRGSRVEILQPRRGPRVRLLELVALNARHAFFTRFPAVDLAAEALAGLQEALGLPAPPRRIEAFDISTTQGREVVASLVVAEDGRMVPAEYRRFKIRLAEGIQDDFAAMREVVYRRYARRLREEAGLPPLVLVDGGAGQVSAAAASLAALELDGRVALCGLAKREEEIYRPGEPEPLRLPRTSPALRLLQQIRDEAHRFAVTYHRKRRSAASFASQLGGLTGLGPARRKLLLQSFGSWQKIQTASAEELRSALGPRLGGRLHRQLNPDKDPSDA